MALVGLESTSYNVSEDVGVLEVCVIVYSPTVPCPINFAFDVSLSTSNDSSSAYGSADDGRADDGSADDGSADDGSAGDEYTLNSIHTLNYIYSVHSQSIPWMITLWANAYLPHVKGGVV